MSFMEVLNFIVANAPELVGLLLPPVIEVVNKEVHTEEERFLVTALLSFVIAFIFKWEALAYGSPEELFTSFTLIFTESQVVYKLYFKESFLRSKLRERLGVIRKESEVQPVSSE